MSDIGIIGYGIVGKAVEYGFKAANRVRSYDRYKDLDTLDSVVSSSQFIFVCLPTPYKGDRIDLTIMDENIEFITPLPGRFCKS